MLLQGLCILCANHYLLAYVRVMRLISFGISLDLDTVSLSSARLSLVSSGPRKLLEGLPQHHAGVLRRERERERQKVRQRERRQKEKERHIGKEREKERERAGDYVMKSIVVYFLVFLLPYVLRMFRITDVFNLECTTHMTYYF